MASRWTTAYSPEKAGAYYEQKGLLQSDEFSRLFEDTLNVRMLEIADLDWLLFDHALSVYRSIPLLDHYRAAAQGIGTPFEGIEALYRQLIDLELFPPWILNQTLLYRHPQSDRRIGELMVAAGLMTEATVQRSLSIKQLIFNETGVDVAIGQVFRTVGPLSVVDFFQILGVQVGIPFESLDASAPAIFQAAMER